VASHVNKWSPAKFLIEFFTVLKYFLSFRNFEQLTLALKTKFALKIFTALNIFFIIHRIFEQVCACPEKRSVP